MPYSERKSWLLLHFHGSEDFALHCLRTRIHPNPSSPSIPYLVWMPYILHQALPSPAWAIAIHSLLHGLPSPNSPPFCPLFEHANGILFFHCKNSSVPPSHLRMTYKIPRDCNALASDPLPYLISQPISQSIPIPFHPTHSSCLMSHAASSKKPSLTAPGRPRFPSWVLALGGYLHDSLGPLYALYCLQISLTPPCWPLNSFRAIDHRVSLL